MAKKRKLLITTLKIVFSVVLIYFIFTKIDITEIGKTLKKAHFGYLALALLFFVISKVVAAFRLNSYFNALTIALSHKNNLKLYLLGMFYNLFLPGGIGGDAYKAYIIQKKFQKGTKKIVSVVLLDRLSGLLLLFIFSCLLAFYIPIPLVNQYKWGLPILIILGILVFWALNKKFFRYVLPVFWRSFGYSAVVQLAQLICVFFIAKALHLDQQLIPYLFIFLVSSIVAVVPLTLGGIGSRELTFFYGASLLSLNEGSALSISVLFFIITALVSLMGVYFHFKKPLTV